MRAAWVLGVLCLLLVVAGAQAHTCATWSTSTTDLEGRHIIVDLGVHPVTSALRYFYYDACHPDCVFSFGFYAEMNGIEGLQREDDAVDDTCHGLIEGDLWTA